MGGVDDARSNIRFHEEADRRRSCDEKVGNSVTSSVLWRVSPALCHYKTTDDGAGKLTFWWPKLSSTL